ncbi:MAG: protein kinase [Bradymonadaceae bacterium]|nr:protein kinase [Lujinxingiaceae bacterium]
MSIDNLTARMEEYLSPGHLFEGKYRIIEMLGEGSFASVVHARHEIMGRDVALKFLKPEVVEKHPEVSARFVKEVQIVSRLTSTSTVTIFDFGETAERIYYMVLEYVDGETLDCFIAAQGASAAKRCVHICDQILDSLGEAHAHAIVHRDLKPANIMISSQGDVVKVLDFGVAKMLEDPSNISATVTGRQSTQFIGTPIYMSPEQILGQGVGPASDLYSLGLILYELLTGEVGVDGKTVANVARQHLDEAALPFSKMNTIALPLQKVILRATARHARDRYASAQEFRDELTQAARANSSTPAAQRAPTRPAPPDTAVAAASLPGNPAREDPGTRDVFSGKGYVDLPDEDYGEGFLGAQSAPRRRAPAPLPQPGQPRAKTQPQAQPKAKPARSEHLSLDMASVHRQQRERVRPASDNMSASGRPRHNSDQAVKNALLGLGCAALATVGLYTMFVLITSTMMAFAPIMRLVAGLFLPAGLAILWAGFATVTVQHKSAVRRWFVPVTRNVWAMMAALAFFFALFGYNAAAQGLKRNSTWFFEFLPGFLQIDALMTLTQFVAVHSSTMFIQIGKFLPW